MHKNISDVHHLKVMQLISEHPNISQRELALHLGFSVGKINYCIQALVNQGLVKIRNLRNSKNKNAYAYLLTPEGMTSKASLRMQYLQSRIREYDALKKEIEQLQRDMLLPGASGD